MQQISEARKEAASLQSFCKSVFANLADPILAGIRGHAHTGVGACLADAALGLHSHSQIAQLLQPRLSRVQGYECL